MTTRQRNRPATGGERLRAWRHARAITQRDAAQLLGTSASHLSLLERNLRCASPRLAARLAAITGVPVLALLGVWTESVVDSAA